MKNKKPGGKHKESARPKVDWKALEIVHPNAAGIAVGGSEHWVAVSPERDPEPGAVLRLLDRKSTRLNSSHSGESRMPSSA